MLVDVNVCRHLFYVKMMTLSTTL